MTDSSTSARSEESSVSGAPSQSHAGLVYLSESCHFSPEERITLNGWFPTKVNPHFLWGIYYSPMNDCVVFSRLNYEAVQVRMRAYAQMRRKK